MQKKSIDTSSGRLSELSVGGDVSVKSGNGSASARTVDVAGGTGRGKVSTLTRSKSNNFACDANQALMFFDRFQNDD